MLATEAAEMAETAKASVESLLAKMRLERPPIDAVVVARRYGCHVLEGADLGARGRVQWLDGKPVIVYEPSGLRERDAWTVAHELGEVVAATERLAKGSGAIERFADRFAGELLAPTEWFHAACVRTGWELPELKAIFRTASYQVLATRMLEVHHGRSVVTVFDNGRQTSRRGNDPDWPPPPLCDIERRALRIAHRSGTHVEDGCSFEGQTIAVQCWPVHRSARTSGWKREVLRTVIG